MCVHVYVGGRYYCKFEREGYFSHWKRFISNGGVNERKRSYLNFTVRWAKAHLFSISIVKEKEENFMKIPKKKLNAILAELGETRESMQNYWSELIPVNPLVRTMAQQGIQWYETNIDIVRELPTQMEEDLLRIEEEKYKVEQERLAKEQALIEQKYLEDNFQQLMVEKIEKGQILEESEVEELIEYYEFDTKYDDDLGRWRRAVTTVVQLVDFDGKKRLFSIDWQEGLTEYCDSSYGSQPVEVVRIEKEVTKIEVHYEKKG